MRKTHSILLCTWAAALGLAGTACKGQEETGEATLTETASAVGGGEAGIGHAPPGVPFGPGFAGKGVGVGPFAQCDDTPEETTQDVCGQALLATRRLEWTGCTPARHHGPPPGTDGGQQREGHAGRGTPPTADGFLEETQTVTLVSGEACATGAIYRFETTRTFEVTLTGPEGGGGQDTGKVVTVSERALDAQQFSVTETREVSRNHQRPNEEAKQATETGSLTRQLDLATKSVVESGTLTTVGTAGTRVLELQGVTRGDPAVCHFPTAGTLKHTEADGTVHTTEFQATCGTALVDGELVELRGHHGPRGGPGGGGPGGGGRGGGRPPRR
jgi:hypothetical protein